MHNNELTVTVDVKELLTKLKANRKKHNADYQAAKKGFRKLLIEELEDKLEDAKAGERVDLSFDNHQPESHLEEYDDVIQMLQMATNSSIDLTHQQFKQYVQDDWNWKRHWSMANAMYLSAGA